MDKRFVRNWLRKHKYCVVATSFKDNPWAATVDYTCDDDLTLFISTDTDSVKFQNIVKNPVVSVVVDSQTKEGTLQIQGIAKPVNSDGGVKSRVAILPKFMIYRRLDDLGKIRMTMLNLI